MTAAAGTANPAPKRRRILWGYLIAQAIVGAGCAVLFIATNIALVNAFISGDPLPPILLTWAGALHLLLIYLVLPLTLVQFFRRKGDRLHRRLGYAWAAALMASAAASFGMHQITGGFGPAHTFSVATLISIPLIVLCGLLRWRWAHRWLIIVYLLLNVVAAGYLAFDTGRALGSMLPEALQFGFLPD